MKALITAGAIGFALGAGVAYAVEYFEVIRGWLKRGGNIDVGP